mmetsp:Transcript_7403/g.21450  ORF Transcript_7403/g.21450 Transcript_7403/m.21450 type:complete len:232 (+) Transcript_7403:203-898(+)
MTTRTPPRLCLGASSPSRPESSTHTWSALSAWATSPTPQPSSSACTPFAAAASSRTFETRRTARPATQTSSQTRATTCAPTARCRPSSTRSFLSLLSTPRAHPTSKRARAQEASGLPRRSSTPRGDRKSFPAAAAAQRRRERERARWRRRRRRSSPTSPSLCTRRPALRRGSRSRTSAPPTASRPATSKSTSPRRCACLPAPPREATARRRRAAASRASRSIAAMSPSRRT